MLVCCSVLHAFTTAVIWLVQFVLIFHFQAKAVIRIPFNIIESILDIQNCLFKI